MQDEAAQSQPGAVLRLAKRRRRVAATPAVQGAVPQPRRAHPAQGLVKPTAQVRHRVWGGGGGARQTHCSSTSQGVGGWGWGSSNPLLKYVTGCGGWGWGSSNPLLKYVTGCGGVGVGLVKPTTQVRHMVPRVGGGMAGLMCERTVVKLKYVRGIPNLMHI